MRTVDMHLRAPLVRRKRDATLSMRLWRRQQAQRLADKTRGLLEETFEIDPLQRIAARKRTVLFRVGQAQCSIAQLEGMIEKIVDDDQGSRHTDGVYLAPREPPKEPDACQPKPSPSPSQRFAVASRWAKAPLHRPTGTASQRFHLPA